MHAQTQMSDISKHMSQRQRSQVSEHASIQYGLVDAHPGFLFYTQAWSTFTRVQATHYWPETWNHYMYCLSLLAEWDKCLPVKVDRKCCRLICCQLLCRRQSINQHPHITYIHINMDTIGRENQLTAASTLLPYHRYCLWRDSSGVIFDIIFSFLNQTHLSPLIHNLTLFKKFDFDVAKIFDF
jgi:hypothetical protein